MHCLGLFKGGLYQRTGQRLTLSQVRNSRAPRPAAATPCAQRVMVPWVAPRFRGFVSDQTPVISATAPPSNFAIPTSLPTTNASAMDGGGIW